LAKLQSDLKEFIALLNSRKAEYIVVGGHAVAFHGYPRFTGDIDFFLRATSVNAERVLAVLKDFGFGDLQIGVSDLTTPNRVIQLGRPPNRIDLLTSISGVEFDDAWPSRVSTDLDGEQVSFLGLNELIQNKRASNREKDRADVSKLLAIAQRKGAG
jgi:predicted nucleotidyltransferase